MPGAASSAPARPALGGPGLAVFLAVLGCYVGVHVALRLALSPVVAIDDAREALLSQTLELGYLARQPPLYNWFVWAAVRALGISAFVLVLCRYATLALAYLFGYLAAVRVLGHRGLAALAAFSLLLVGPFNWDAHEELTHSLAAVAAAAATFHALLRLERSGGIGDYLGLGLAVAAGFLAKFSYGLFAGALLIAAFATPAYRRRLVTPRVGLTFVTALLLCLPFALWFVRHDLSFARMYAEEVRREGMVGYLGGMARGFSHVGRMLAIYLVPVGLLLPAVFWRARRDGGGVTSDAQRLLARLLLAELSLVVLGILGGASRS